MSFARLLQIYGLGLVRRFEARIPLSLLSTNVKRYLTYLSLRDWILKEKRQRLSVLPAMKEVEGRQPIRIEFLSLGSYLEFSYSIECLGFSGILVGVVSQIIIYCPKAYYSD